MSKRAILTFTLTLFLLPLSGRAETPLRVTQCQDWFSGRAQAVQSIHPVVLAWLDSYEEGFYSQFAPQTLDVGNGTYPVLKTLGSGYEGAAYLVQNGEGLAVVKVFFTADQFRKGVQDFTQFSAALPKVHARDSRNRTMLIEYREGIPVQTIMRNWDAIGLTHDSALDLEARFKEWRKSRRPWLASLLNEVPSYRDFNVVYSFKDNEFYLFDAF